MELGAMKRGPLLLALGIPVVLVLVGGAWALRARSATGDRPIDAIAALGTADVPRAPEGERIRVQVLNTTRTRGLARRAARLLRSRGFDVVEFGTAGPARDTTLVLDRSGHPAWATAAAEVLGHGARAEARPDSSRYLDVTVLIGVTWRPPAQPLDP